MSSRRATWVISGVLSGALVASSSCGRPPVHQQVATAVPTVVAAAPTPPHALPLVINDSPLAPSFVRIAASALPVDTALLGDPVQCQSCHADVVSQWDSSVHRGASLTNKLYAAAVEKARADKGALASRFCAGCHDASLLLDARGSAHGFDSAWDRDDAPKSARAGDGVACLVCHQITEASRTGDGGYRISPKPFIEPDLADPKSIAAHKSDMAPRALATSELCASCHKVSLPVELNGKKWLRGQNDFDAWEQSSYALGGTKTSSTLYDPEVAAKRCQDCHMGEEASTLGDKAAHAPMGDPKSTSRVLRSHRFLGANTAVPTFDRDPAQVAREESSLKGAVRVDLVGLRRDADPSRVEWLADGPSVAAGEAVAFDVVVENTKVGHRFPGGTGDSNEVWLEVIVRDADGALVGESGALDAAGVLGEEAHRFGVLQLDDAGKPALLRDAHRFVAAGWDTTIGPKDAKVVRVGLTVPATARLPLKISARVLYRKVTPAYLAFACATKFSSSPAISKARPCPTLPITEIASVSESIGDEGARGASAIDVHRLDAYARGLLNGLQEEAGLATPVLDKARALTVDGSVDRARVVIELARVRVREGRTGDADALLDEAATIDPTTPVIPLLRGVARYEIYRLGEAVEPLQIALERAPKSLHAFELLGEALELRGDDLAALSVLQRGLAIDPESAQLRHLEALAFDRLELPDDAAIARAGYLAYRRDDDTPKLRAICRKTVPGCEREQTPIHTHALLLPR
ncbi:MAG: multiheme c-type cytochrome [Polyangiales bacterium]